MKNLSSLILCALLIVGFSSCTDDDSIAPTLNITAPTDPITVKAGESFLISGSAIDDVEIDVLNMKSTDLGLNISEPFTDALGGSFEITVEIDANTALGDYTIDIEAIDLASNIAADEVKLTVIP